MNFMQLWQSAYLKATDAPSSYGVASGLMALSTISLGRAKYNAGSAGINTNLYMMITGPTSVARKSTSVKFAQDMVEATAPHLVGPRDYTMEALAKWMGTPAQTVHHQSRATTRSRLCIFSEEFSADLAKREAYNGTFDTDFCALYDGSTFERVRSDARKNARIVEPRVNLFAACAHEYLSRYLDADDWHSGLLMRFLFVEPNETRPEFTVQPSPPAAEWDAAHRALQVINEGLTRREMGGLDSRMDGCIEAKECFNAYISELRAALVEDGSPMAQYLGRYNQHILKLSVLAQLITDPNMWVVSLAAMEQAVKWGRELFWPSFKRVVTITTEDDTKTLKTRLLAFINENGSVPLPRLGFVFSKAQRAHQALKDLLSWGQVELVPNGDGTKNVRLTAAALEELNSTKSSTITAARPSQPPVSLDLNQAWELDDDKAL